jgi:hypothetical protein
MHAHARVRGSLVPTVPNAPAGRHAETGGAGKDAGLRFSKPVPIGQAEEGDFDFSRPLLVDIGRAAVIAEYLRESGYPCCTADVVTDELARPERERSGVGHVAAGLLKRARWRP